MPILTTDAGAIQAVIDAQSADIAQAKAEIARLRAALASAADELHYGALMARTAKGKQTLFAAEQEARAYLR